MGWTVDHPGPDRPDSPLWWLQDSPSPTLSPGPRDAEEGAATFTPTQPRPLPPPLPAAARVAIMPPPGVRLFFSDDDGRPCKPDDAYMWCWEGAPRWIYTLDFPPPEPVLSLLPVCPIRCSSCAQRSLRVVWRTTSDGWKQLRCECAVCGRFIDYLKQAPVNADLEYRADKA